jgi:hypothetical protein
LAQYRHSGTHLEGHWSARLGDDAKHRFLNRKTRIDVANRENRPVGVPGVKQVRIAAQG